MRTLLIWPPTTVYGDDPSIPPIVQPLGLAYLAAWLEKEGHEVSILDGRGSSKDKTKTETYTRYGLSEEKILKAVDNFNPDIIGISNMWTAYSGDPHRVAKSIKEKYPDLKIIFGGSHPSEFPELVLKDSNVDLVVTGEGEITFSEILYNLEKNLPLNEIHGIAYMEEEKVVKTQPRERMTEIDQLPFPARHLLPMELYLKESKRNGFVMRKPSMAMASSRGCPQKCVFCTVRAVWGRDWEGRSPSNVVDEIAHLTDNYGVKEIAFLDDDLGRDIPRLGAICDEIIRRKVDIKWTTPNGVAHWLLNERLIDKMKQSGCYRLTFGIESGCEETRKFIKKKVPLEQATRMIKHSNKIGLWTICTFILGFPYETKAHMRESIHYAIESETDMGVFYALMPHPTSDVYSVFKNEGLLDLDPIMDPAVIKEVSDFAKIGEILSQRGSQTKYCSSEEIQEMLSEAYQTFFRARLKNYFLNPLHIIRKIRSYEDLRYSIRLGKELRSPIRNFLSKKRSVINMLWDKYNDKDGFSQAKICKPENTVKA
jgi:magnesium-protoporphyrin IX monomethyl ester (oxidative) cyclase